MHHLDFEKVVDQLLNKYESVVRMSVKARAIAEGQTPEGETIASEKVTTEALHQYLDEQHIIIGKP